MLGGIFNRNIQGYYSGVCSKCIPPKLYASLPTHYRYFPDHKPPPVEIVQPVTSC